MIKKIFFILILLMGLTCSVYADTLMVIGDSIAYGYGASNAGDDSLAGFIPSLVSEIGWTGDTENQGVSSEDSGDVAGRIASALSAYSPTVTYLHVGSNDPFRNMTVSETISNISDIYIACVSAGSELIINEVLPREVRMLGTQDAAYGVAVRDINAEIEYFCYTNKIKMSPIFQEMVDPNDDNEFLSSYTIDAVHPNSTGYGLIGPLIGNAAVPRKMRTWGSNSYPTFGYSSWVNWCLTNASVTGDSDTGSLDLSSASSQADSNVLAIKNTNNTIEIRLSYASGSDATVYYRTSDTYFDHDAGSPSWTAYSSAFSLTTNHKYIQVRLTGGATYSPILDSVALDFGIDEFPVSVSDGVTLSDNLPVNKIVNTVFSDGVVLSDSQSTNIKMASFSDGVILSDGFLKARPNIYFRNVYLKRVHIRN